MIYSAISVIFSIVAVILFIKKVYKQDFKLSNKICILEIMLLILGFSVRLIGIDIFPNALNVDEASEGYEAFSILNNGIDRHGKFMPVFFISWGSGQNVLLSYLILPFVKLLGLSILSVRLPMAILGCFSLMIMYLLLRKISTKKVATIGLAFFAICPWHIMKSRWGLESNVFPDLILISVYFLIKGLEKNKYSTMFYYLSFFILGISAYSYGTSYFFLPFYTIFLLIILLRKKEITVKKSIISFIIVFIVALPIILCVFINKFNLSQIELPFMTIPKLAVQRYENISSIFSENIFKSTFSNLKESLKIIIFQDDSLPWNSLPIAGITYKVSIIFTIIGIVTSFNKKRNEKYQIKYFEIFNLWFIVSIVLSAFCEPNINRINIIWIPIIYYTILGIYVIIKNKEVFREIIIFGYIVLFINFGVRYFTEDANRYFTFESNLDKIVSKVNEMKQEENSVYITNSIKEPYIFFLFYSQYDSNEFINTVKYSNENEEFQIVDSFGNYYFQNIEEINDKNGIYVIRNDEFENFKIDKNNWKIQDIEDYKIINYKKGVEI